MEDAVWDGHLAHVMEQEAEFDLRVGGQLRVDLSGELEPERRHSLGVLSGVGVTRLHRVRQRAYGGDVGVAQLLRPRTLRLERLAQIRGVALELPLFLLGDDRCARR